MAKQLCKGTTGIILKCCDDASECATTHCTDVGDWTQEKTFEILIYYQGPTSMIPSADHGCPFSSYHELAITIEAFVPDDPITEPNQTSYPYAGQPMPGADGPPDGCYYKGPLGDGRWILVIFHTAADSVDDLPTYSWYMYDDEAMTTPTTLPRPGYSPDFVDYDQPVFARSATLRPLQADCDEDIATFNLVEGDGCERFFPEVEETFPVAGQITGHTTTP